MGKNYTAHLRVPWIAEGPSVKPYNILKTDVTVPDVVSKTILKLSEKYEEHINLLKSGKPLLEIYWTMHRKAH